MNDERNTSQEQTGAFNAPEGISNERLAQQQSFRQSVEERAAELARIDGRSEDEVREEDRERAREELASVPSEQPDPPLPKDVAPSFPAVGIVDEPKESPEEDEQLIAEEQARHGIREAEHDTMIQERDEEEARNEDL